MVRGPNDIRSVFMRNGQPIQVDDLMTRKTDYQEATDRVRSGSPELNHSINGRKLETELTMQKGPSAMSQNSDASMDRMDLR